MALSQYTCVRHRTHTHYGEHTYLTHHYGSGIILYSASLGPTIPQLIAMVLLAKPSRSSGFGLTRVSWSSQEVEQVAREVFKGLPDQIHNMLEKGPYRGPLITLSDEKGLQAQKEDLKNNYPIVKPFVRIRPNSVPSGYFCADVLLCLDVLCQGNLLNPSGVQTKKDLALANGSLIKRMIGHLRHLRCKAPGSYIPEVSELKELVTWVHMGYKCYVSNSSDINVT
jgi:hypothetical protein